MFTYYNAHPKGLHVGDCVKRAIVTTTGMDYMEVQRALNHHKTITGCKKFNDPGNPEHYIQNVLHATKMPFPAKKGKPRMNGERFCQAYPKGSYILSMAGHWSTCVNGVIYDTWDTSEKCVYTAYKMTRIDDGYTYKLNPLDSTSTSVELLLDGARIKLISVNTQELKGYLRCLHDLGYRELTIRS